MSANTAKKSKAIDRPFDPADLAQAKTLVEQYQVLLKYEDGEWYGRGLELPGAMADGPTPDACIAQTREAMIGMAAYMLEQGRTPPAPAQSGQRTEQINIRLSAEERLAFETAAQRRGYRGLSDFVRDAALRAARDAA